MRDFDELNPSETAKYLDETWRTILSENGIDLDPAELSHILTKSGLSLDTVVAHGLTIGAAVGLRSIGDRFVQDVKTRQQLDIVLLHMREAGDKLPSILRKASKQMVLGLRRNGGPGRKPKLSPREAVLMCDQIAAFIRTKCSLKQALQMASELSPSLLDGKRVSPRTLQKAWDKRDQYLPESDAGKVCQVLVSETGTNIG